MQTDKLGFNYRTHSGEISQKVNQNMDIKVTFFFYTQL